MSFDLIYVGSNPTGENRCLVDKAIKRHLSRVSQRRKTWSLPACFDFRKEHGILRPPRKQNGCSISGQKKSVQQRACLYCLRRQNKPYPMVRSRELHTAPALCRALAQENQEKNSSLNGKPDIPLFCQSEQSAELFAADSRLESQIIRF